MRHEGVWVGGVDTGTSTAANNKKGMAIVLTMKLVMIMCLTGIGSSNKSGSSNSSGDEHNDISSNSIMGR